MSSSSSSHIFILCFSLIFVFALFLQHAPTVNGSDDGGNDENAFLGVTCGTPNKSSTTPSPEISHGHLEKFLTKLPKLVRKTGFATSSESVGGKTAYALALCRGDLQELDCEKCVFNATKKILQRCHQNHTAIIWYDFCYLKYSSENFLGHIDEQNKLRLQNGFSLTNDKSYVIKTKNILVDLAEKTAQSPMLYSWNNTKFCKFHTQYSFAQCSKDISPFYCKKCLMDSISVLEECCLDKQGSRLFTGSCMIRNEIYYFLDETKSISTI